MLFFLIYLRHSIKFGMNLNVMVYRVLSSSLFSNRVQRVVLSGKMTSVTAGVPQGSVLGPLFFSYTLMICQTI